MTEPAGADPSAGLEVARVKAITDNAERLGLVWVRTVGEVFGEDPVTVQVDGDTEPVGMTSMIGPVFQGQRVYVDQIPPAGNFIVGHVAAPRGVATVWGDRQTLATTTSSMSFTVPASLRSVRLKWFARCTSVAQFEQVRVRINGSSAAVYGYESLSAFDAISSASLNTGQTSAFVGYVSGSLATAGIFGTGETLMQGWDRPGSILSFTSGGGVVTANGLWNGTAGRIAIASPWTSIQIFPNAGSWVAGSDFQLEGITS